MFVEETFFDDFFSILVVSDFQKLKVVTNGFPSSDDTTYRSEMK